MKKETPIDQFHNRLQLNGFQWEFLKRRAGDAPHSFDIYQGRQPHVTVSLAATWQPDHPACRAQICAGTYTSRNKVRTIGKGYPAINHGWWLAGELVER